ncbi:MAG: carboxypeptidase regulatory-like domain-containing protein [Pseudomonadota bacterium]|nr:carboxypeptidase regulatory-like domain-containing protein [Pseudomonadota bacterium]
MNRRFLVVLCGLFALAMLVCAGLVTDGLARLHPELADPSLSSAPPRREVRTLAAHSEGCGLVVEVQDATGAPLVARVVLEISLPRPDEQAVYVAEAAEDGVARFSDMPCSPITMTAQKEGFVSTPRFDETATDSPRVVVVMRAGRRVHGTVRDLDGAPIAGAEVGAVAERGRPASVLTDADGSYVAWVETDEPSYLYASAHGFDGDAEQVPESPEESLDFALTPAHPLRVWCTGMPDESCEGIGLLCTAPWEPVSMKHCMFDADARETVCTCPMGEVAVRGGGRTVLVAADATDAWLDFRDTGVVTGRVLREGIPARCRAAVGRIPLALEDLPRGGILIAGAACDAEGRFEIDGVVAGDWQPTVMSGEQERSLLPRRVRAGERVDLGDIEITGGAVIEGVVVDGLTGAPLPSELVIATRRPGPGQRRMVKLSQVNERPGFQFTGLPAGTWSLVTPTAPQHGILVVLREDQVVTGVEVPTSDDTSLVENGFTLTEGEFGSVVVGDVIADSPAGRAGLEAGERITGVRLAGVDVDNPMLARWVLGAWDGPGVTLLVEGEAGPEAVPLEW